MSQFNNNELGIYLYYKLIMYLLKYIIENLRCRVLNLTVQRIKLRTNLPRQTTKTQRQ